MKKVLSVLLSILLLMSCSKKRMAQTQPDEDVNRTVREHDFIETEDYDIIRNNGVFSFNLYARLSEENKNLLCSPYSISTALAMTYAGAANNTEKEMSEVLLFSRHKEQVHAGFKTVRTAMESHLSEGLKLNIANSLWVQQNLKFRDAFMEVLKKEYASEINTTDFRKATDESRRKINNWVEEKTEDKIKDLIKEGMLSKLTRLVLVNAIYFNADWQSPFDENLSHDAPFFSPEGKSADVRFMRHRNMNFNYFENEAMQLLELPYKNNFFSMLVFLPKNDMKLNDFEQLLTYDNYSDWTAELSGKKMEVFLPKFNFSYDLELSGLLKEMGMPEAFSNEADFSGMTTETELKIDKVLHKAFIDVNEKGTEAAAATAVIMVERTFAMPEDVVVFKADRPFFFVIRSNESGSILFMGRLLKP